MRRVELNEQRELQIKMLDILDKFCSENNLRYFLYAGSLLGAVREKGFIPWDDDIDVVMPREDYEIFSRTFNDQKNVDDIEFLSFHQNKEYYTAFGKLINSRTVLKEAVDSNLSIGVFLDIFPLDNLGNTMSDAKRLIRKANKERRLLTIHNWKIIHERAWYLNCVIWLIKKLSPKTSAYDVICKIDTISKTYSSNKPTLLVGCACAANHGEKEIMKSAWFEDYEELLFEGKKYRAPRGYDAVLKRFFGDYMTPPSKDKQVSHHVNEAWWK